MGTQTKSHQNIIVVLLTCDIVFCKLGPGLCSFYQYWQFPRCTRKNRVFVDFAEGIKDSELSLWDQNRDTEWPVIPKEWQTVSN